VRALMQVFLEEKNWEGCGGLELNDEIRITIAARRACSFWGSPTTTIAMSSRFSSTPPPSSSPSVNLESSSA